MAAPTMPAPAPASREVRKSSRPCLSLWDTSHLFRGMNVPAQAGVVQQRIRELPGSSAWSCMHPRRGQACSHADTHAGARRRMA